jgi:type IV pilus assembly protein PilM
MNFKKKLIETLTIKFDKAFGLDISDRSVELIEVEKFFKFSVVTYGRAELPEGVIDGGRIIDQNILAEKLKKLLKEAKPRRISTNKVVISLPESQVFIRCFTVAADLKSKALSNTIIEKVSLLMPQNIDKTYWDYIEKPLPDKTQKLITFVSIPKDIANSYVKFCNSIGLEIISLCTESMAMAKAILSESSKQSLIIDIGSRSSNLSFFDSNDKLNMSINIPVGGDNMTYEIKEKLKIEEAEAEALKIKFGFKEEEANKVRPIILPIMEDILNETKQAISYYEENFKQKLDDIYIIGGSSLLPAISNLIKTRLNKEVRLATPDNNISLNSLNINNFPFFANVIGLGMMGASGQFTDLNLLKQMPSSEVNVVNRLSLFNMGYLSRVNTIRTIINNKYVLVMMIIVIGIIFAVLLQQVNGFGPEETAVVSKNVGVKTKIIPKNGTSTPSKIGSSTLLFTPTSTSTSTKNKLNVK